MNPIIVEREIAGRMFKMQTGGVAKFASGALFISHGGSTLMTTCMRSEPRAGIDFFPMQCDYRERMISGGRFPGGFRKREGAPSEKEILTMRLMDRPIRPLFPDGFFDEVQIQAWTMEHDGQNDTDVIACNGASAALCLSDAPFEGPVATVRVGRMEVDGSERFVLFPTHAQMEFSDLDLVLSGHKDGINMIEVGAAEIDDEELFKAIQFGYEEGIRPLLEMQLELMEKAGATETRQGNLSLPSEDIYQNVKNLVETKMREARQIKSKSARNDAVGELRNWLLDNHYSVPSSVSFDEYKEAESARNEAKESFRLLEKKTAHKLVAEDGIRADGRQREEIRPLQMGVSLFERTHGSAWFERGETQNIVTCALGSVKDEQIVDGLMPEYAKKFYLHYNFPPFCVGEAGRIMGPGRREIGHGALAERSLLGVLPGVDEFPYTIRLVSDITMSNGSSSMASVCGGCLALMDAGVPIRNTVAGISVGRFTSEDGNITHVTDIIGEEDFFGEMDFKVCGTREGITGIQLDLKARGLGFDEIKQIFAQAKQGRIELINKMEETISAPRSEINQYAPRIVTLQIQPDKIGKLIGPGGKTIRGICEKTGAQVDVEDDGTVIISATDKDGGDQALAEVEALTMEVKVGSIYEGKVVSIRDFGAFVEIASGMDGLCHISELAEGFVKSVEDVVQVGDSLRVKVIKVDEAGRIKLSHKVLLKEESSPEEESSITSAEV